MDSIITKIKELKVLTDKADAEISELIVLQNKKTHKLTCERGTEDGADERLIQIRIASETELRCISDGINDHMEAIKDSIKDSIKNMEEYIKSTDLEQYRF